MSNPSNTFTGPLTDQGGTITVASLADSGAGTNGSGNIVFSTAAVATQLTYTGSGSTTTRGLTIASTTGGVTIDSSGTGALAINGTNSWSGAGSKALTLQGSYTGGPNTFGGIIGQSGGTTSLTLLGSGTWILGGSNTYSGATTIGNAATLTTGTLSLVYGVNTLAGPVTAGGTATITVNAGSLLLNGGSQTIGALSMGGGVANTSALVNIGSGGYLNLGGTVTLADATNSTLGGSITGGQLNLNGNRTFTINHSTNAINDVDMYLSSVIADGTSASALTFAGVGLTQLTGVNTYSCGSSLTAGTVSIAADTALGAASGSVTFNGGDLQITGTGDAQLGARRLLYLTGASNFDIRAAGNTYTIPQPAGNTAGGNITKLGDGVLTMASGGSLNFEHEDLDRRRRHLPPRQQRQPDRGRHRCGRRRRHGRFVRRVDPERQQPPDGQHHGRRR